MRAVAIRGLLFLLPTVREESFPNVMLVTGVGLIVNRSKCFAKWSL